MDITHMDTTRTAITDRIRTMATTMGLHTIGTVGIDITATTVIIITAIIGNKFDVASRNPPSWLDSDVEPAFFEPKSSAK